MKTKRFFLFCILIAAVLTGSTNGLVESGLAGEIIYPTGSNPINPFVLKYIPDMVILSKDNIVYLLSSDNRSIFRWSIPQHRYLTSISLQDAPTTMAYSSDTNRLYLNYVYFIYQVDPHITQINLNETTLVERPFVNQDLVVSELETVGSYVFTRDNVHHTIYSPDGELISQVARDARFAAASWSPTNRRMYLFDSNFLPHQILRETIHEGGVIEPAAEITDISEHFIYPPVHIRPDGPHMFFSNGTVLDANTYTEVASPEYIGSVMEATWNNDYFYTLENHLEGSEIQKREAQLYNLDMNKLLKGSPIRLLSIPEGLLVITNYLGRPWFYILNDQLETLYETIYHNTYLPFAVNKLCYGFKDDFSSPSSGWAVKDDEYVRSEYVNGEYRVLTKDDRYYYLYAAPSCSVPEFKNYSVDLDVHWVGEPGFAYGIVYEISPDFEQYNLLLVNTDYQEYGIYQYRLGGLTPIMTPEYFQAINPGNNINHLKIFQDPYGITRVEINNRMVWSGYSGLEGPAYVGLVSVPYDDYPESDARFDNFELLISVPDTYGASVSKDICSINNPITVQRVLSSPQDLDRFKP